MHAYHAVIAGAEAQLNTAARHLARTVRRMPDPREPQFLLMNFNDADWNGIVELQPWTDFLTEPARALQDEEGRIVPFQAIEPEAAVRDLQRIAFRVRVPAFGWRTLRFAINEAPTVAHSNMTQRAARTARTEGWELEIDPGTGAISRLANRKSGAVVFAGPAHVGLVVDDPTDTWSHGIDRFPVTGSPVQCASVAIVEEGPVRCVIDVRAVHGQSRLLTTVILPHDADLPVELRVTLDWREANCLLRLAYPLGVDRLEYEIPAGWIQRPADGREYPEHRWVRAVRSDLAVAIINDAKYSFAAADGTLFMTAVRSPVFAHHDPMTLQPGAPHRHMDQGEQRFTIQVHAAPNLSRLDTWRIADALMRPPIVIPHVSRGGDRDWSGQWLQARTATSVLTAVKLAEDSDALVLRALELEGEEDRLILQHGDATVPARGITTILADVQGVAVSDGLERGHHQGS